MTSSVPPHRSLGATRSRVLTRKHASRASPARWRAACLALVACLPLLAPRPGAAHAERAVPSRAALHRARTAAPHPAPTRRAVVIRAVASVRAAGADTALLLAIARRESSLDPRARNRASSARGLMQFTDAAWLDAVRAFGARHGLARYATLLSAHRPAPRRAMAAVLRLRDDPHLATAIAADQMARLRPRLEQRLARNATSVDLYLVHLLGPTGALRFLTELSRDPAQNVANVVSIPALHANPGVFALGGQPRRLDEIYLGLARMLDENGAGAEAPATEVAEAP